MFQSPLRERIAVLDKLHLLTLIKVIVKTDGPGCSLNHLDVSNVRDFKEVFYRSSFIGDISEWDMSNATRLDGMFEQSQFNSDISKWTVSNVTSMERVFNRSQFQGDISKWNTGKVTRMKGLFWAGKFNGDLSRWNVSQVTHMDNMFNRCPFKTDISKWDVSRVISMQSMFSDGPFDNDISKWNVANVQDFSYMFASSLFQGDISQWNTSNALNMSAMFAGSAYRSHLSNVSSWDVSKVQDFSDMFRAADGPRDVSSWKFSHEANMTEFLSDDSLVECDNPSIYHWFVALSEKKPTLLREQDREFLAKYGSIFSTLCVTPMEAALMTHRAWQEVHQDATCAMKDDTLPLPELDSLSRYRE